MPPPAKKAKHDPPPKIRFQVNKVSSLTADPIHSHRKTIGDFPWAVSASKSTFPHWEVPDFSVVCLKSEECRVWHCYAIVEVAVINQADDSVAWGMKKEGFRFSSSDPEMKWTSMTEQYGLININEILRDDKVIVEVTISEVKTAMDEARRKTTMDLLTQSEIFDCTLQMKDVKKVYVNRQFLALHSRIFKDLFFGEFKGTQAFFKFEDVNPDKFIVLVKILYRAGATVDVNNVAGILKLARRFEILVIVDEAEEFLLGTERMNSMDKLKLAEKFRLATLKDQSLNSIDNLKDLQSIADSHEFSPETKRIVKEKMGVMKKEKKERDKNCNELKHKEIAK